MNDKKYLKIIIPIFLFALFLLLFVVNNKNQKNFIIFPDNNIYLLQNNKVIKYNDEVKKKTSVTLISDDETKKLTFTYINGIVDFYENNKHIDIEDYKYAYTKKVNIIDYNYNEDELDNSDLEIVQQVLNNHNIDGYDNLTTSKIKLNDNNNEYTLYFISNLFEEYNHSKVFSFVYYIKNNDIIYLVENVSDVEKIYDICLPNMNSFVKINDNYNLFIDCNYYSEMGNDNIWYQVKNNKLNKIN